MLRLNEYSCCIWRMWMYAENHQTPLACMPKTIEYFDAYHFVSGNRKSFVSSTLSARLSADTAHFALDRWARASQLEVPCQGVGNPSSDQGGLGPDDDYPQGMVLKPPTCRIHGITRNVMVSRWKTPSCTFTSYTVILVYSFVHPYKTLSNFLY